MKYNKRAMKGRTSYKQQPKINSVKKDINWKKLFLGWVAVDCISSLFLAGYLLKKKNEKPIDKMTHDLNKKYKTTRKKFTKKADRLLKDLENTRNDLFENVSAQAENFVEKPVEIGKTTMDKSKETLQDLQSTLDDIIKK